MAKMAAFVRELREDVKVPMVLMTYANVVFSYGAEKFIAACRDIGFGISTPAQAEKMAGIADGVIVGSAIIKLLEAHGKDAAPYVAEYVRSMKDAVRNLN